MTATIPRRWASTALHTVAPRRLIRRVGAWEPLRSLLHYFSAASNWRRVRRYRSLADGCSYLKGTYLGLVREYKDEEALIQEFVEDPDHYYVQFDNRWLLYAYGWHKFPKSEWRIHG